MSIESREDQDQPQNEGSKGERWSSVLQDVHREHQPDMPWYHQVGLFFAWSGGIALAVDVVAILVLLVVALVSTVQFTAFEMSNWLFWASCVLLFAGLFVPSASELQETAEDRQIRSNRPSFTARRSSTTQRASGTQRASDDDRAPIVSLEERRLQALRKRLRRVYNPWRWRLWASAGISFALTVLIGSLA
jgi:hypothetical protein